MSVNWTITTPLGNFQPIENTETTQRHPYGTMVNAVHATYGAGKFVYAKGVASTVAGDFCTINYQTGATVRADTTAATSFGPGGVAMSANVASQYGWYQVFGISVANCATTVAAAKYLQTTATVGVVDDTTTAGKTIVGMTSMGASGTPAANQLVAFLNFPWLAAAAIP